MKAGVTKEQLVKGLGETLSLTCIEFRVWDK